MDLIEIIDDAASSMPRSKMVHIDDEVFTIIGDVHGDIHALKMIERVLIGKAVFLGDYADRGEHPVEVYREVLEMFLNDEAILLRGNHESTGVYPHELPYQLKEKFGEEAEEIYQALQRLWSKMPVSAIVEGELWMAHGGVPTKKCRVDLEGLRKCEIANPDEYTALEIMWNDPWEREECGENYNRGVMYFYGKKATRHLLNALDVKLVVRSHEPQKVLRVEQDGMVVTLGSCAHPYWLAEFAVLRVNLREGFRNGYDFVSKFGAILSI